MTFEILNESNFMLYAMKHYDNPHCTGMPEFHEDLAHIKYLKRLFRRYNQTKDIEKLRIRLTLNHLILLYNVFGEAATRILFYKLEPSLWPILKTFLIFLNYMPEVVNGIQSTDIGIDMIIVTELRQI